MDLDRRDLIKGIIAGGLSAPLLGPFGAQGKRGDMHRPETTPITHQSIKSTCAHCVNFCGIEIQKTAGVITGIYPDQGRRDYYNHGICPKGVSGLFNTYNPHRITKPLKRTNKAKGPDVDPGWVEISYQEAFDTMVSKMDAIRKDNPAKLIWQHGHGKYLIGDKFPKAFAKAFGTPNLVHRTTSCEAARHVADELSWGYHGFLPDFKHTRLFINFGGNYFEAEQFSRWLDHASLDAKAQGMKTIVVEPRLSVCGAKADQWLPIRPGKDVLLLLAIARELIDLGYIDQQFLLDYTNAPVLIDARGQVLKDVHDQPMVWDRATEQAKALAVGVKPQLRGSYRVKGQKVTTAFELFAQSVQSLTPEYVQLHADVSSDQVKKLARLIGEQAMIGATIQVDGKSKRLRPVVLHTFRGLAAKQYGTQHWRAALMVQMLIGSIDAVGGIQLHSAYKKPQYFEPSKAEYPPQRVDLQQSIYFPYATHNVAQQVALSLLEPQKYGLQYQPEMQIFYATNRPFSTSDTKVQYESLKKTFNVCIDIVMSETANMSDIVLPDLTYLESWHFAPTRYTPYTKHLAIRQPVTNAYNIPHDGYSILWQLAKRLGFLDDYIKYINKNWGLKNYPLQAGKDYSAKQAVEHIWLQKTKGIPFTTAIEKGFVGKKLTDKEIYWGGIEKAFWGPGKPKLKFYADQMVDSLLKIQAKVEQHQLSDFDLKAYRLSLSPFPLKEHGFPTPHLQAKDYPFYLITFKQMYRNQSGNTATNPLLNGLGPDTKANGVVINADSAAELGITNGAAVVLETRVGKLTGKAILTQGIRPDTVAVSYHFGQRSHGLPDYAKTGIGVNAILESHSDLVSGMDSFNDSKCKLYAANSSDS